MRAIDGDVQIDDKGGLVLLIWEKKRPNHAVHGCRLRSVQVLVVDADVDTIA